MDYLKDVSKNISLYEVKAYVRKAQNGMFHDHQRIAADISDRPAKHDRWHEHRR